MTCRRREMSGAKEVKAFAKTLQLCANVREVVDLAVVHNGVAAIVARHRLVTTRRQIDDRESRVSKRARDIGIRFRNPEPRSAIVRAAMVERLQRNIEIDR